MQEYMFKYYQTQDYMVKKIYHDKEEIINLSAKIKELEKENKILEKINKENQEKIKRQNELLAEENISKQYGDEALFYELEDYKEAIDKIKEICQKYDAEVGDTIIANPIQDLYDISQIINEVNDERNNN